MLLAGICFLAVEFTDYRQRGMIFVGYTWIAAFYAAFLLIATSMTFTSLRLGLSLGPLRKLGSIAFGVYLLHIPILGVAHELAFGSPPRISNAPECFVSALALVITIALSVASLKWLEAPFNKIGKRYSYDARIKVPA
jgi:peptidoglycan/LPS O-acetylase OafA/YrhL